MFSFLKNKRFAPLLGLDISATSAKLVELSMRNDGRLVLERCALVRLENPFSIEPVAHKFDQMAHAIRRLMAKSRTKTKTVAMALPPSSVITKIIHLPKAKSNLAFEVQVEQEATRYIPFPLNEVNLDYQVIGPNLLDPELLDVHLAVSRREKVQDIQDLADATGLELEILDVSSYASRAAMKRLIDDQYGPASVALVALVELGTHTTSVRVMRNDEVLHDRDLPLGGEQLTQIISEHYHWSMEAAETRKRSAALPADYAVQVRAPFVEKLAEEIHLALRFFIANSTYTGIDAFMLAGGCASLVGLQTALEKITLTPCFLANPFQGMLMSERVRLSCIKLHPPAFLTACGLALRRFPW